MCKGLSEATLPAVVDKIVAHAQVSFFCADSSLPPAYRSLGLPLIGACPLLKFNF
jgi:hypothetical protein